MRVLLRSGTFMAGVVIVGFWVICALFGSHLVPIDPYADDLLNSLVGPSSEHWFGTDSLGRDIFSRVIVGSRDILSVAPLATIIGTILGTALGLVTGYFRGFIDDAVGPRRRRLPGAAAGHHRAAGAGGAGHLQHDGGGGDRRGLRPHHRAHRARGGAVGARARLCRGGAAARGERAPHHVRRDPAQCDAADPGRNRRCAWAMRSSPWPP